MEYKFWGKVRKGQKRGKKLGFPTANINLSQVIPEGIYISKAKVDKKIYPSITFIGIARTFNATKYLSETYILDFNQDLYNKLLSIVLLQKIRENQKFNSVEALIETMKEDEQKTRRYFKNV